jgi:tetratricopeptide (TPR) repeat protein
MLDFQESLDKLYDAGDYDKIEKIVLSSIEKSANMSFESAALFNELAGLYKITGRLSESEKAYEKSLDVFDRGDFDSVSEYVTVLINLVGLYRIMGEFHKALEIFNRALTLMRRFFGETEELAAGMLNVAEVYELLGDVPSTIAALTDAIAVMSKVHSADAPSVIEAQAKLEQLKSTLDNP